MSREERSEIFFLRANDTLFKPKVNSLGESIVTSLMDRENQDAKFTDIEIDPGKDGYFIIAAPST